VISRIAELLIGPAFGTFLAILSGLIINDYIHFKKRIRRRNEFLELLRLELDGAIRSSVNRPGDLISEIAFKSFIYSELAEYFEVNEIYEINNTYFAIQAYNYESKRLRDIAEELNFKIPSIEKNFVSSYFAYAEGRHYTIQNKELIKTLQKLKYKDWFREDLKIDYLRNKFCEVFNNKAFNLKDC
jgi:hypothetical protein